MSPAYQKLKNVPKVTTEQEASNVLLSLIPFTFILRIERGQASGGSSSSTRHVQISQTQLIKPEDYYGWFYEGSQWTTYIGGIAMVAIMLAAVMFPLWPSTLRLGVWYLSIGVLGLIGLFFAIAIVRLIFYIITVIVTPPGIWVFPKLFADVGVVSLATPYSTFNKKINRVAHERCRSNPSSRSGNGISPSRRKRRGMAKARESQRRRLLCKLHLRMARVLRSRKLLTRLRVQDRKVEQLR